ncbi:hypothetical protein BH23ACI1_BH23ACI1_13740 [soil metagenome]
MIRVFTVVIALAIPGAAAAQVMEGSREIGEVRSNARGHIGPFYVTPSVLLKELGVDSNVFNAAGEPQSDFTFTLKPALNVWVPMAQRAMVKATIAPDMVWYAEHATERSVNPDVTVRGDVYLNRITLFGERGYLSTRERPNHEVDVRSRHVRETVAAGVSVAVTPKLSVQVAGRQVDIRYDTGTEFDGTSLARTLNRETRGVQLTLRHRLTPLTTLALRSEVLEERFEFSPMRNSDSRRVMPGVEFAPQALIKGSAYVGYRTFTPLFPEALPEFGGIVGELGLSYALLGSTVFGASYRRDLTYSYSELQPFFVDNAVGASIRRALGRRFDLLLSGDRHKYDYRNMVTAGPDLAPRVDTTWAYGASLGYRIGRESRIGFGVSHLQRESTNQARTYKNLRFGTTFGHGF